MRKQNILGLFNMQLEFYVKLVTCGLSNMEQKQAETPCQPQMLTVHFIMLFAGGGKWGDGSNIQPTMVLYLSSPNMLNLS